MKHMNDYDLTMAQRRHDPRVVPNRARLTEVVTALAYQTNANSDGWAYWPKPRRAAQRAIALIESTTNAENDRRSREDITDAELVAALRPIKAFLTRQGWDHRSVGL